VSVARSALVTVGRLGHTHTEGNMIMPRHILTEHQTALMRRLYQSDIELDDVSRDYVGVILSCLDTIDDLRVALQIERGQFAAPPTR